MSISIRVSGVRHGVCEKFGKDFGLYGEDGGVLVPLFMTREQLKEAIPQLPVGSAMREAMEESLPMKGEMAQWVPQTEEPDYW